MMRFFRVVKYTAGFSVPVSAFLSMYAGGWLVFLTPVYAFIFIAGIELLFPVNQNNLTALEEEIEKKDNMYDILLYLNIPVQFSLLYFFLHQVVNGIHQNWEIAGMTVGMGVCCGVIGINVAHELGHRKNAFERFFAKMLLLTSLYMHYIIEHNKGHHKRVSTPDDPSSARINESIYQFYPRTIIGTVISAWRIQQKELNDRRIRVFSLRNELILFFLIEILFVCAIGIMFSWLAMVLFICAAFIGILLLEAVNYIEHYGLSRNRSDAGNYERVQPWHSWNSDHVIGRVILYELTRHSDHHYLASRKYQILRHLNEAPQLPAGYPAMILLSFVPPLFFKLMNPRVKKVRAVHYSATQPISA